MCGVGHWGCLGAQHIYRPVCSSGGSYHVSHKSCGVLREGCSLCVSVCLVVWAYEFGLESSASFGQFPLFSSPCPCRFSKCCTVQGFCYVNEGLGMSSFVILLFSWRFSVDDPSALVAALFCTLSVAWRDQGSLDPCTWSLLAGLFCLLMGVGGGCGDSPGAERKLECVVLGAPL